MREKIDRTLDDMESKTELAMARRIHAALIHPDNPVPMFDMDARKLSRHIGLRLIRMKGPSESRHVPKYGNGKGA